MLTFRRFAPLLLGAALVACDDDSTGPGAVEIHFAAQSLESLGRTRMGAGDWSGATASRLAALALRTGLRPGRVRIAVDGVTEEYWALEVEHALARAPTVDALFIAPIFTRTLVAWRGGPAERVISITMPGDTATFTWARIQTMELRAPYPIYIGTAFGILFERGGPAHFSVDGTARSTRHTIGEECALPSRPAFVQLISQVPAPTRCQLARFFTRFNMRVQQGPPAGAAAVRVRVVAMDGANVPGIRLEYPWFDR